VSFKVLGIEHMAIATKEAAPVMALFQKLFSVQQTGEEEVPQQKVLTQFFDLGGVHFELLQPTSTDSPISKYLEKRGNGFHHLAVRVDRIEAAIEHFKSEGIQMIDDKPRTGAGGCLTAFVHPKSFGGLLVELVERPLVAPSNRP
jgi:methylmalonyl-CoA epimerase